MPKELPIDLDTPPPSHFSDSWADEQFPPEMPPSRSPVQELPMLPGSEPDWTDSYETLPITRTPSSHEDINPAERGKRSPNWKRRIGGAVLSLLALAGSAGIIKSMNPGGASEGAPVGPKEPVPEQVVEKPSPLEKAYESANVEESHTPYEFVSGTRVAELEKADINASIDRNSAEFIKGVKLSSGLTINFYEAHITPEDQKDKLEIDGRAVEQMTDFMFKAASELPSSNPYANSMKRLYTRAQNGELNSSNISVIISTRGECLDSREQEIINDDMNIKGLCAPGVKGGVEHNYDNFWGVKGHNIMILLSDFKMVSPIGVHTEVTDEMVNYYSQNPKYLVKGDAEDVGYGHELAHAFVALAGRNLSMDMDKEHQLFVIPMQNMVARHLLTTPGANQKGENRFISPFSVVQR